MHKGDSASDAWAPRNLCLQAVGQLGSCAESGVNSSAKAIMPDPMRNH